MVNKKIWLGMLVMVLVFGMTVVGCDTGDNSDNGNGTGNENSNGNNPGDGNDGADTWTNVTSFSQVNGSWKAPSSYSATTQGMTFSTITNNYIMTFDATAKTMSVSGSVTTTISGGNVDEYWSMMKQGLQQPEAQLEGLTYNFNDATHTVTYTYNNFTQTLTDSQLTQMRYQINQNGSKLKITQGGTEVILTKQ